MARGILSCQFIPCKWDSSAAEIHCLLTYTCGSAYSCDISIVLLASAPRAMADLDS
jgi:hypothetical protein